MSQAEKFSKNVEAIASKLQALQTSYQEQVQKAQAETQAALAKANEETEKAFEAYEAVRKELNALPREPTRNSIAALVNKTLQNKNNNTKLKLLGNLAGKSTLFSKKQNRIAKGREAMIQKHFNLSKKNYNAMTRRKANNLESKYSQLSRNWQIKQARGREIQRANPIPSLQARYTKAMTALAKELLQIADTVKENSFTNLTNESQVERVKQTGLKMQELAQVLDPYLPAQPAPVYRAPEPVSYEFNAREAAAQFLQGYRSGEYNDPEDFAEEMGMTENQMRSMLRYLYVEAPGRRGRRGENNLEGDSGYNRSAQGF